MNDRNAAAAATLTQYNIEWRGTHTHTDETVSSIHLCTLTRWNCTPSLNSFFSSPSFLLLDEMTKKDGDNDDDDMDWEHKNMGKRQWRVWESLKQEKKKKKKRGPRNRTSGHDRIYIDNAPVLFFVLTHTQAAHNHWRIVELRPFSLFYTRVEYLYIIKGKTTTAGVKSWRRRISREVFSVQCLQSNSNSAHFFFLAPFFSHPIPHR